MAKNVRNNVKVKKIKNTNYFKELKSELKKVIWPTPKALVNSTIEIIIFVLVIAIIVFILDLCFDNINKYGITRGQEYIQSLYKNSNDG